MPPRRKIKKMWDKCVSGLFYGKVVKMNKIITKTIGAFALIMCSAMICSAETVFVSGGGSALQNAINAAAPGDELVVAPGTYSAIDTQGTNITIRSAAGPNQTFLTTGTFTKSFGDAWGIGSTVKFAALLVSDADTAKWAYFSDADLLWQWTSWNVTQDQHSTLIGFTILRDGVPAADDCFSVNGGKLINCIFRNTNIHAAEAVNCLFVCPTRTGGELVCDSRLVNCTVIVGGSNNSSEEIYCSELLNTIVYARNVEVEIAWSSVPQPRMLNSICYNIRQFDGEGSAVNLSGIQQVDPRFSNSSGGDYTLAGNSPGRDAGDNAFIPVDIQSYGNLNGGDRIVDGVVDRGAYEYGSVAVYDEPFALDLSYGPYVPGEMMQLLFPDLVGYAAQGLPAGITFDAKTGKISGIPIKPTGDVGMVVTFSKTNFETLSTVLIVGPFPQLSVGIVGEGMVTGAGSYAANKTVPLKTTAKVAKPATASAPAQAATVFAGWFTDSDCSQPLEAGVDYRTPSLSYVMPAEDVTLYAKFIPASEDTVIMLTADDGTDAWDVSTNAAETVFNTSGALELALWPESYSLPKLTVSGLPAGLKFTAKPVYVTGSKTEVAYAANTIYGTATKPGTYVVTVKLTNTTIKKAIERKFTIVVDNFTGANSLLRDPFDNARGDRYEISAGVTEFDLPLLRSNNGAVVKVSGLPAGLKYNASSGEIAGVATKAGTFTATVTVGTAVSTFTVQVDPLPDWLIGSYECGGHEGRPNDAGYIKLVISASGSVAGKVRYPESGKVITESFKYNLTRKDEDGAFWIEGYDYNEAPGGYSTRIYPTTVDGVEFGRVESEFETWEEEYPWDSYTVYLLGAKDVWTKFPEGSTARPLFSQGCSYYFADDYANVFLELVFGNDGTVKVFNYADDSDTTAYSVASARLVPYEVQGDSLKAYCSFVIQGRDHAIGLVLKLSINTSYGTVYDSDIVVDEYHLQYAD